jgi:hypothetical protein
MTYTNYGYACSAQYMPTAARAIKRDANVYIQKSLPSFYTGQANCILRINLIISSAQRTCEGQRC